MLAAQDPAHRMLCTLLDAKRPACWTRHMYHAANAANAIQHAPCAGTHLAAPCLEYLLLQMLLMVSGLRSTVLQSTMQEASSCFW
jgi:hypothetical protein